MDANFRMNDEEGRIRALHRFKVLNTEPEQPFENIVSLVKTVLNVPICAISLVETDRQWFKAHRGLAVDETPADVSFCHHTIGGSVPLEVCNAEKDERFSNNELVMGEPHIRSYLGIPLQTADGYNIGSLCAIDTRPRRFSAEEVSILEYLSNLVLQELELRQIATTDEMTGALSRRGWMNAAELEIDRAFRNAHPLSLLVFDIDRFKRINDTFGHNAGDRVIEHLAKVCRKITRSSDIFGRLGGEEFGIILPETNSDGAICIANRLRVCWSEELLEIADHPVVSTISIGVAQLPPDSHDLDTLLESADRALYIAKHQGRNRCVVHETASLPRERQAAKTLLRINRF